MAGEREQPLAIQWAGSSGELTRLLMSKGWKRPPSLTVKKLFEMLATGTPLEELPILPRIHDGRTEDLRLALTNREMRLVLRLWPTGTSLAGNDRPVLIGTVEQQRRRSIADVITMASDDGAYDGPLNDLERTIGDTFKMKRVHRTNRETRVEHDQQDLRWHGEVLLIWAKGNK